MKACGKFLDKTYWRVISVNDYKVDSKYIEMLKCLRKHDNVMQCHSRCHVIGTLRMFYDYNNYDAVDLTLREQVAGPVYQLHHDVCLVLPISRHVSPEQHHQHHLSDRAKMAGIPAMAKFPHNLNS